MGWKRPPLAVVPGLGDGFETDVCQPRLMLLELTGITMAARTAHPADSILRGIGLVSFGIVVGFLASEFGRSLSRPALVRGLDGDEAQVDTEFARRVRAQFPVGSSQAVLIATLSEQGFTPKSWRPELGASSAEFNDSNLACNVVADIHWRADTAGNLTFVKGSYHEHGCL